jgi:hypothetical protein
MDHYLVRMKNKQKDLEEFILKDGSFKYSVPLEGGNLILKFEVLRDFDDLT